MGDRAEQGTGSQAGASRQGRLVRCANVLCFYVDVSLVVLMEKLISIFRCCPPPPGPPGGDFASRGYDVYKEKEYENKIEYNLPGTDFFHLQVGLHDLQWLGHGGRYAGRLFGPLDFWRRDVRHQGDAVSLRDCSHAGLSVVVLGSRTAMLG